MTSELAKAIDYGVIVTDWKFYILVAFLSFLSSFAGNYVGGYANKRGQNLATKADFDDLKAQLKETTEVTEQIKKDIEHQVWKKQQMESLRRQKLEEFLICIYAAHEQLLKELNNLYLGTTGDIDIFAFNKSLMIMLLYFPELRSEHLNFIRARQEFRTWIGIGMEERARGAISQVHREGMQGHLYNLQDAIIGIETKANQIATNWTIS
jgi:hypothetical protein